MVLLNLVSRVFTDFPAKVESNLLNSDARGCKEVRVSF